MPSGGFSIRPSVDTLTPDLKKKIAAAQNPQAILRAAGTQIVSIAKRSFREPALRQKPWPNKKDGAASNLIDKGVLSKSIRIVSLGKTFVEVGSDRIYAAIHQLGGVIVPKTKKALVFTIGGKTYVVKKVVMPSRPYLPFTADGKLTVQAEPKVRATIERALGLQLK